VQGSKTPKTSYFGIFKILPLYNSKCSFYHVYWANSVFIDYYQLFHEIFENIIILLKISILIFLCEPCFNTNSQNVNRRTHVKLTTILLVYVKITLQQFKVNNFHTALKIKYRSNTYLQRTWRTNLLKSVNLNLLHSAQLEWQKHSYIYVLTIAFIHTSVRTTVFFAANFFYKFRRSPWQIFHI